MQLSGIKVRHMGTQAKAGQSSPSFDGKLLFPTPDFRDKIVVEVLSRKLEDYSPITYGTAHPSATLYPNHRLVLELEQNEEDAVRYYAADRSDEDLYNFSISYSGDAKDYPIFTHDYIVRRSAYEATTRLIALSGLAVAKVTAGGTGYTQETTTASLSGGTGSGGALSVLVSNGAVIGIIIESRGNYTVAPTVTINSTGGGTGATGTVAVQLQTATLVKEDMLTKTGDERIDSLYVLVRRIYETLPGPRIPQSDKDPLLGRIQIWTQAVAYTGQLSTQTATGDITYQARNGSAIVALKIEREWGDGTGSAGNPLFPVVPGPMLEDERGQVHSWSQLQRATLRVIGATVRNGGSGGTPQFTVDGIETLTVTGTTGTGTKFQALVRLIGGIMVSVESIAVAGAYSVRPTDLASEPVTGGGLVGGTLSLQMDAAEEGSANVVGSQAVDIRHEPYNEFLMKKVVTTWALPGPRINKVKYPYGTVGRSVESRRAFGYDAYVAAGRTANGTAHPDFASALLVDEWYEGDKDAFGFLVQRFDQVPSAANQTGLGYSLSYPEGDTSKPRLTWRYKATRIGLSHAVHGDACPITGYTSLVLSDVRTDDIADADFQVVVTQIYEILPGAIVPEKPDILADGSVVTRTRQRVVNGTVTPSQVNGSGTAVKTTEEAVSKYVAHKIVETITYSGTALVETVRDSSLRGADVTITRERNIALSVESGSLVLASSVRELSTVMEERVSQKAAGLPSNEVSAFWDYVPLPLLIFGITHNVICNATSSFFLSTIVNKAGGASLLRKHRKTVSYHNTYPDPDLSGSTFVGVSIQNNNKIIKFDFNNVLNDALSFSGTGNDGVCTWSEDYEFDASEPSATDFAAGDWFVRDQRVEEWGTSGYKATLIEFYSAEGNPSIE